MVGPDTLIALAPGMILLGLSAHDGIAKDLTQSDATGKASSRNSLRFIRNISSLGVSVSDDGVGLMRCRSFPESFPESRNWVEGPSGQRRIPDNLGSQSHV